ncbi:hypothetical protein LSUE1_G006900 [Lachnellula suecica]|uniref:Uncharacterized protein n=1 Tax=Lachnellula suecica TaxID=602035 RepID=A0A8T9BZB3_9HELO|nr:hypothetical protein LSUE1_G006900 [Lachnellula suecica]
MLTWPRQLALSRFYTATTGKARGFEPKKEPETVKINRRSSHFIIFDESQRTPADSVQLTDKQANI